MNQRLQQKAPAVPSFTPAPRGVVQRKSQNAERKSERYSAVPPNVHEVLRSPGQPLAPDILAFFEPRFGHDFGDVRVHTNARAGDSAKAVNALAYTAGPNIVLPADSYRPASPDGRKLLAHELTHVVQQSLPPGGGQASEQAAETEANRNAIMSERNNPLAVTNAARGGAIQRQAAGASASPKDAPTDIDKVVRAAERARRDSSNATSMMINGSEIVYRLIHEFLPDYNDKMSGVGYRANVKEVEVQGDKNSISVTVGNDFILGTSAATIEKRALDLGRAIFAKAPRPAPTGKLHGLVGSMMIESRKAAVNQPQPQAPAPPPPEREVAATFGLAVPGLGPEKTAKVEELIKNKDRQAAVDLVVQSAGTGLSGGTNISTSLLDQGKMNYDREVTWADGVTGMPRWDYMKDKAEPAKVRIGPGAFSSAPYLYSVIIHEYQHVLWNQSLKNQEIGRDSHEEGRQGGGKYTSEIEAYVYELLHLEESGLSKVPEKIAEVWRHLNEEFWTLDQATQKAMQPKVQRALAQAQRFVRGTQVTLDRFAAP
jgi:hypothetical protein